MLNQNAFTVEDVRVSVKQFGLGKKGTANTSSSLSSTTLVFCGRKGNFALGQVNESYKERGCNISYGAGKVIPENKEPFLPPNSNHKKYLNLIRAVYSSLVLE